MQICEFPGCNRVYWAKGLCHTHNSQLHRTGKLHPIVTKTGFDWLKEHVTFQDTECLIWPNYKNTQGYGKLGIGGKVYCAHVIMCKLVHESAPEGKPLALHKCNNKSCVNPHHLYWGSDSDNKYDRYYGHFDRVGRFPT